MNDDVLDDSAPIELQVAQARKLNAEANAIERELSRKWWQPQPKVTAQVIIGSIVAGCLAYAFALDNLITNYDLVSDQAEQLAIEKSVLQKERDTLEENRAALEKRFAELTSEAEFLVKEAESLKLQRDQLALERDQLNEAFAEASDALFEARSEISRLDLPDDSAGDKIVEISSTLTENVDSDNFYPVVASVRRGDDVRYSLAVLQRDYGNIGEIEVFETVDSRGTLTFALTLGSNLSEKEARRRVKAARDQGLQTDPYVWRTDAWGENVADRFK